MRGKHEATRHRSHRRPVAVAAMVALVVVGMVALSGADGDAAGQKAAEPQEQAQIDRMVSEAVTQPVVARTLEYITETPVQEETPVEEKPELPYTEDEVIAIAKTVYGEALITHSDEEMSAVVWCILNRVDSERYGDTISEVLTKDQFHGFKNGNPVDEHIEWLVRDVLDRWVAEQNGQENVGRTLPAEYLFFCGDGWHNYFRTEWEGGTQWDWSLPNPYES